MNFSNVKEITIPEGKVKEIVDSAGKSLWKSGPGYIYLKLIDRSISGTYTNETVESIGENAFDNCSKLTTANFPAVTSIGDYAFYECLALETVDFPAVTSIGENAFGSCHTLATVDFPAATDIGASAFYGCFALTTLILRSETMATLGSTDAFSGTPISSGTGYIYVSATLVDTYKAATNWSTYANQIRAIEDYPEIIGDEMA